MDVLYIIKADHDAIRARMSELEASDEVKTRCAVLDELAREVEIHLLLERDYLYPEIAGLFAGAEIMVDLGLASAVVIGKKLKSLSKLAQGSAAEQSDYPKRLAELKVILIKHLEDEERNLMPKIRHMIRTEEREDLGQVLLDIKDELVTKTEQSTVTPATSRKRA